MSERIRVLCIWNIIYILILRRSPFLLARLPACSRTRGRWGSCCASSSTTCRPSPPCARCSLSPQWAWKGESLYMHELVCYAWLRCTWGIVILAVHNNKWMREKKKGKENDKRERKRKGMFRKSRKAKSKRVLVGWPQNTARIKWQRHEVQVSQSCKSVRRPRPPDTAVDSANILPWPLKTSDENLVWNVGNFFLDNIKAEKKNKTIEKQHIKTRSVKSRGERT